ncbi:MAG: hypothetical protein Q9204_003258 [Flavoplaca sp. TL-2023a]
MAQLDVKLNGQKKKANIPIINVLLRFRDGKMLVVLLQPLPSKSVSWDAEASEFIYLRTQLDSQLDRDGQQEERLELTFIVGPKCRRIKHDRLICSRPLGNVPVPYVPMQQAQLDLRLTPLQRPRQPRDHLFEEGNQQLIQFFGASLHRLLLLDEIFQATNVVFFPRVGPTIVLFHIALEGGNVGAIFALWRVADAILMHLWEHGTEFCRVRNTQCHFDESTKIKMAIRVSGVGAKGHGFREAIRGE